jgi:hypothetical protein
MAQPIQRSSRMATEPLLSGFFMPSLMLVRLCEKYREIGVSGPQRSGFAADHRLIHSQQGSDGSADELLGESRVSLFCISDLRQCLAVVTYV